MASIPIKNLSAAPQDVTFPLCLHYMEAGDYSGVITSGTDPTEETIRYVVRLICQGESDSPIRPAAKDALTTLANIDPGDTVTQGGDTFSLTFIPVGEWPLTTVIEGGVMYRQLGFFLAAHVFRL